MIVELAGYHCLDVCCIEMIEALFKIILQLNDCDEQSELVTVELLVSNEVSIRFLGYSNAADAC